MLVIVDFSLVNLVVVVEVLVRCGIVVFSPATLADVSVLVFNVKEGVGVRDGIMSVILVASSPFVAAGGTLGNIIENAPEASGIRDTLSVVVDA